MPRFCVIGAGACGLTAVKSLREHGFSVECFERQDDVGGNWYFGSPHSSMYASASMISSKRLTEFPDFRMPREFPHFPSHQQAHSYLRSYAQRFDLFPHIQFNTTVERVEPARGNDGSGWSVQLSGEPTVRTYDGVLVASGHHCQPNWPKFVEAFSGQVIHSRDYREPSSFSGQRLLVVGAGNSGCDIAAELSRHAAHTSISLRRGYHFMPKFLCGAPLDRCGETMARFRLPWFVYRGITAALLRIAVGSPQRYGLPRPDHRLLETHPIVNSQLLHEIGHGRVNVCPAVKRAVGHDVTFADDSTQTFDTVICATGYRLSWPFLPATIDEATGAAGLADRLQLQVFDPLNPNLFFVGLIQPNGGIWALANLQAQLIAKVLLAKERSDGSHERLQQAISGVRDRALNGGLKYSPSPRHQLEVEYFAYRRALQRLLKRCERMKLTPRQPSEGSLADGPRHQHSDVIAVS